MPTLSICVPSRNRQLYFQHTIRSLLSNSRQDVEFVFADNSDEPEIMNRFMEDYCDDPRVVFLPAGPDIYSMMNNWERTLKAATGRYVSFIGDDDYLDPDLAAFITNLEKKIEPDAIAWSGPSYYWPTEGSKPHLMAIPLSDQVRLMDKQTLMRKAFLWEGASHVPLSGYSIYHGALSRKLLDKLLLMGKGRYFEFPVIDYEIAFKAIMLGQTFVHVSRPFSILGVCPLSNSSKVGNIEAEEKQQQEFFRELGRNMNEDPWMDQTPFRTWHGITACVFLIQHWLAYAYDLDHRGYEQNLVRALAANCSLFRDRESFDIVAGRYREAIRSWKEGQFIDAFHPVFHERTNGAQSLQYYGVSKDRMLLFPDNIANVATPGDLFAVFASAISRAEDIPIDLPETADVANGLKLTA